MSEFDVRYREGEPSKITAASPTRESDFEFTIEGRTARLVHASSQTHRSVDIIELNQLHDSILELPYIDRVTVWMRGRTDTTQEDPEFGKDDA